MGFTRVGPCGNRAGDVYRTDHRIEVEDSTNQQEERGTKMTEEYRDHLEDEIEQVAICIQGLTTRAKGVAPPTLATCLLARAVIVLARIQLNKNGA